MEQSTENTGAWRKGLLIYGLAVILTVFSFFPVTCAGVFGVYVAAPLVKNASFLEDLELKLSDQERVVLEKGGRIDQLSLMKKKLQSDPEFADNVMKLSKEQIAKVNWTQVYPPMNFILFGIVGIFLGVLNCSKFTGVVPLAAMYFTIRMMNNPLFDHVEGHGISVMLGVIFQFIGIHAGAWLGQKIPRPLDKIPDKRVNVDEYSDVQVLC